MASRSKTEPPTGVMFRPQPSGGLKHQHQHQHSQTDSFLTAARLIRNGWTDEGKTGRTQLSTIERSVHQPVVSKPSPKSAEIILKASSTRLLINSRKTDEDKEIPEQMTNKVKQFSNFSGTKQRERQAGQAGVVYFHVSGCRTACRQSRRFKAPLLPVIAEM